MSKTSSLSVPIPTFDQDGLIDVPGAPTTTSEFKQEYEATFASAPEGAEIVYLDPRVKEWGGLTQGSPNAAAYDLFAAIESPVDIGPGQSKIFATGIKLWIKDPNIVGMMHARSGLGVHGLILGNGAGVIDSDYQGAWHVSLWNRTNGTKTINPGDRIAQVVFTAIEHPEITEVAELSSVTQRGEGGLGSTGA